MAGWVRLGNFELVTLFLPPDMRINFQAQDGRVGSDLVELTLLLRSFQRCSIESALHIQHDIVSVHDGMAGRCGFQACLLFAQDLKSSVKLFVGDGAFVGLIPGGGGTKEFALRASDELHDDEPETITLKNRFFTIATAKVSTSAQEAFDLGILKKGRDFISINPDRRIADAKNAVLDLYQDGYTTPVQRTDIKVLGRSALGALYAGIHGMWRGNYATDHDVLVARKLAYVMCGGDLSEPTQVSEQYLLDLERQAFLSLCGEKKTLERLQSVIKSGKPVRN
jgi:3-hydroxyacyl-CoA dehydrogenase